MRTVVVIVLSGGLVLAAVVAGRAAGPGIDEDTRVQVLSTHPVRVILPIDPDEERIRMELVRALRARAATAVSSTMRSDLNEIANDDASIRELSGEVAAQFASGEVAAVAMAKNEPNEEPYSETVSPPPRVTNWKSSSLSDSVVPPRGSVGKAAALFRQAS